MKSIYLDTSVACRFFDKPTNNILKEQIEITKNFWKTIYKYKLFYSKLIIAEIMQIKETVKKESVFDLLEGFTEVPLAKEAIKLSKIYLDHKIFPSKEKNDALHIALAVVHKIYYLVTWNQKHMANSKVRKLVNAFNILNGYAEIDIVTPADLL